MNQGVWLLILLFWVSIACISDDHPISHISNSPAFVIDSIRMSATVLCDTLDTAHMTFFAASFTYHFEGRPGALTDLIVSTGKGGVGVCYSPAGHIPINLHHTKTQEFWDPATFSGQDSIFVRLEMKGVFWEINNNVDTTYGSFTNKDSLWVRIQR